MVEGQELVEGNVVVEVSGRPLFVLEGDLPPFRSFATGLNGPDVLQLELALERLGFDPGPVDGVYGSDTAAAVDRLYSNAGYRPPETDAGDAAALIAAEERVELAVDALDAALAASGAPGLTRSAELGLDTSVSSAELALSELRIQRDQELAALSTALNAASRDAELAHAVLENARARHEEAALDGTNPDTGLEATAAVVNQLYMERLEAEAGVEEAAAAIAAASLAHENAVRRFENELDSAATNAELARIQRVETLEEANTVVGGEAVQAAREELVEAQSDLAAVSNEIGTRLPTAEVLFLPSLPREVQRVNVNVGDTPTGPVVEVSGSGLLVTSEVSPADRELLEVGLVGTLDDVNSGASLQARVVFIADQTGGEGLAADRFLVRLEPTGDVPEELLGQNLRLRIPISATGGEVLTVPIAALSATSDGGSRVERVSGEDTTDLVDVRVGLTADGLVEIEPVVIGALSEADRVVVGRDSPGQDVAPGEPVEDSEDE